MSQLEVSMWTTSNLLSITITQQIQKIIFIVLVEQAEKAEKEQPTHFSPQKMANIAKKPEILSKFLKKPSKRSIPN